MKFELSLLIFLQCAIGVFLKCDAPPGKDKDFETGEWLSDVGTCQTETTFAGSATCTEDGWVGQWCGIDLKGIINIQDAMLGDARETACPSPIELGLQFSELQTIRVGDEIDLECESGAITTKTCSESGEWVGLDCDVPAEAAAQQVQQSRGFLFFGQQQQAPSPQRPLSGTGGQCIGKADGPYPRVLFKSGESYKLQCTGMAGIFEEWKCTPTGQWSVTQCPASTPPPRQSFFFGNFLFGGQQQRPQQQQIITSNIQFVQEKITCPVPIDFQRQIGRRAINPKETIKVICTSGVLREYFIVCEDDGKLAQNSTCNGLITQEQPQQPQQQQFQPSPPRQTFLGR